MSHEKWVFPCCVPCLGRGKNNIAFVVPRSLRGLCTHDLHGRRRRDAADLSFVDIGVEGRLLDYLPTSAHDEWARDSITVIVKVDLVWPSYYQISFVACDQTLNTLVTLSKSLVIDRGLTLSR